MSYVFCASKSTPWSGSTRSQGIPRRGSRSCARTCSPRLLYLNDLKRTFVDGNAAAGRISGYKRDEPIDRSFLKLNLLAVWDVPEAASLLAGNVPGDSTGPDEFTLIPKDGASVVVEMRPPPRIGNRRLVLGIAGDISARKRAETGLQKSDSTT
jgi:PAS domain S-box-containing protein